MYAFTKNGVCVTCPGCGSLTPVSSLVPIKVGTKPQFLRVETGRWDWDHDAPETRLAKFPFTRRVDGCPTCADTIAAQRRKGGYDFIVKTERPAIANRPGPARMPRLVKHPQGEST